MTDRALRWQRLRGEEIATGKRGWWYLSYATQTTFLGGVILEAHGPMDAFTQSSLLGLNPGGAALGFPFPEGDVVPLPPERFRNRLLTRAEVQEMWPDAARLGDMKDRVPASDPTPPPDELLAARERRDQEGLPVVATSVDDAGLLTMAFELEGPRGPRNK